MDPPSQMTSIGPLPATAGDDAAALLARVFQHDPMMRHVVGDPDRMLDRPARFYRACVRFGQLHGVVDVTSSLDGIAVWIRPDHADFSFGDMWRSGLIVAMLSLGVRPALRFARSQPIVERLKKQAQPGRHWYLMFLGVDPSRQGRGIGGELIRVGLARADGDGLASYLDSTNERNLSFYRRHGFEVAAAGRVPGGGPDVWAMLRRPPR